MIKTPAISLIMSVYNGEDYLREAIDSVINQTFKDWELIVINDCSKDSTSEILKDYSALDSRIRVFTNEVNLRLPSSLNKALSYAEGKYIGRMDADDICMPDRLEKQFAFMEANSDVDLASCRFITLKNGAYTSGGCGGKTDSESIKALLLVTNPILHPGIIAKADVIKKLGYDKEFTCTEDMELWTRFVMSGCNLKIMSDYLMIYRLHDKQITETTLEKQRKEVISVQERYFSHFLEKMDSPREEFYVSGIYFTQNIDAEKFCKFFKWIKSVNRKKRMIDKEALNYAMFEIVAEYKRKGISKAKLIKILLSFGIAFLAKEIPNRKKRARADGLLCIEAAEKIGLVQSGGVPEFPSFSKN